MLVQSCETACRRLKQDDYNFKASLHSITNIPHDICAFSSIYSLIYTPNWNILSVLDSWKNTTYKTVFCLFLLLCLCDLHWTRTHHPLVLAFWVLGQQVCTATWNTFIYIEGFWVTQYLLFDAKKVNDANLIFKNLSIFHFFKRRGKSQNGIPRWIYYMR